jgi:hypothetical protein
VLTTALTVLTRGLFQIPFRRLCDACGGERNGIGLALWLALLGAAFAAFFLV